MKLGRLRTIRGQITVTGGVGKLNLVIADGLINYGLKITNFQIWPTVLGNQDFIGILSLDIGSPAAPMDSGDNRQIGWCYFSDQGASGGHAYRSLIDPDHVVNRDLFLSMMNTTGGTYNYMIEAQVVELTDDEAIITIIKETSQA